jgi:excisionase family DNA binding protein
MKRERSDEKDELLTKEAVAQWLGVSSRTIDHLMATRALPFLRLGRRTVRFRREDITQHLAGLRQP